MTHTDDTGHPLTSEPGEWMTLLQAAAYLRNDPRTIRRKVAEKKLHRELRRGKSWIWIPESMTPEDDTDEPPESNQGAPGDSTDRTLAVITQQRAMIAWLNEQAREQTAPLVQRIEELATENGRLQAELDAIRGHQWVSPAAPDTARAPWWRRWFAP